MKLFLLGSFLIFISADLFARDSIYIDLQMKNGSTVSKWENLSITLKIRNASNKPLLITHYESWGVPEDSSAQFIIEVQKLKNGKYITQKSVGIIDNLVFEDEFDTIRVGDQMNYDFNFGGLFQIEPGPYRIRVRCRFSKLNSHSDSFSGWAYFSVRNRLKRPA